MQHASSLGLAVVVALDLLGAAASRRRPRCFWTALPVGVAVVVAAVVTVDEAAAEEAVVVPAPPFVCEVAAWPWPFTLTAGFAALGGVEAAPKIRSRCPA